MKRSARVTLHLVPMVSAAFVAGCGSPQRRACVDEAKRIVNDVNCQVADNGNTGSWAPGAYPYRWYWYRSPSFPAIGRTAPSDGGFTEPMLIDRMGRIGTTRGGFGSIGGSSGS
jgi:hypothetical protein